MMQAKTPKSMARKATAQEAKVGQAKVRQARTRKTKTRSTKPRAARTQPAAGNALDRLKARLRSPLALTAAATLLAGAITVFALRDPGYEARAVELTSRDVWVTNSSQLLVGRINKQIDELNSAVLVNAPFDVLQDGDTVLVVDGSKDEVRPLDVASVTLGGKVTLPEHGAAALGGGVLAVLDPATGKIWTGAPGGMSDLNPKATDPAVTTAPSAAIAVSQKGTVYAIAPGLATLWIVPAPGSDPAGYDATPVPAPEGDDEGDKTTEAPTAEPTDDTATPPASGALMRDLPGGTVGDFTANGENGWPADALPPVAITTVGDVPVVLDRAGGTLRLGDREIDLPDAATAVLQQPGPEADSVLVATPAALLRVPLQAGDPQTVIDGQQGTPAQPVLLTGCAHAAWSSATPTYGLACANDEPSVRQIPGAVDTAQLTFRVNRDVIVLNDIATGSSWTLEGELKLINNWDEVRPQQDSTDQDNNGTQGDSVDLTSSRNSCASGKVDPPTASDDEFGVRAGRSTILQVLRNDSSSDCSMVVITGVDGWEDAPGTVAIVADGQALQVTIPEGVTAPLPALTYRVSDGVGHEASASAVVTVVPPDQSEPPVKLFDLTIPVESLGTVSYNVLGSFASPTGDDLFLSSASIEGGDEVTFQPDGTLTFADKGVGGAVKKTVDFVVTDGVNQVPGQVTFDVRPQGTADPIAAPVYRRVMAGRTASVDIFPSVTTPSVEPLRLTKVAPVGGKTSSMIGDVFQTAGTVSVSGDRAGTYYFTYEVTAGGKTAQGLLRVDVIDPVTDPAPPIAMADVAYLPAGGVVSLDPIGNDTDPMGAGLAVIQVDRDPALAVTVEQMQLLTIAATSALPETGITLGYTVANAVGSAHGTIRVIPVPARDPSPPIANNVDVTVRAGDAATIPIIDHAYDPNGEVITLTGIDTGTVPEGSGVLFHTDRAVRYLAPVKAPAKPLRFGYTVTNTSGLAGTGAITINVVDSPPEDNHPPARPQPVLIRAFTGQTVTAALPLAGIDPDGDWVTAEGIAEPVATLGRAELSGVASADYVAASRPGFDTFGYTAADPYGATVAGQVSALVVAPPTTVESPVAPDVTVTTRPGRTVAVNVLGPAAAANPTQHLQLADPAFEAPAGLTVREDRESGSIVMDAPDTEGIYSVKYTVVNEYGMTGSGVAIVTTSLTDTLAPPTADDVFVRRTELTAGQTTVDVPIPNEKLTNPSGTLNDLKVSLDPLSAAAGTVKGRTVTVTLTDKRQVLAYRVTNTDDATATAFLVVPPAIPVDVQAAEENVLPLSVKVVGPGLQVDAGEALTIDIARKLEAADGAKLQLPNGLAPVVTGGGAIGRVDETHVRYTAPEDGDGLVTVTLSVSDGVRDPVLVSMPVLVIAKELPAPVVRDAALTVEAGASLTQDVAQLATAGNAELQASLRFAVSASNSTEIATSLSGTVLTAKAALDAKGSKASLTVTVTDAQGKTGTGTITITATGSIQPRLRVKDITINDGRPNQPSPADVLGAVTYNPFPTPPTIVTSKVTSGSGAVAASGAGALAITPGAVGTVVVSYTLRDATGDPDRDVTGTVTVIVQDRPDVPGTATVVSMESHTVQIKWTAPKDNGSPITHYLIADKANGFEQQCPGSPCTLTDLTNGTEYRFTVVAVNAIGESEPSVPSAPVTPDTAPNTPSAPVLTWTPKASSLMVAWSDPGSEGTPVSSYTLRISPSDKAGRSETTVTGGTNYTWDNLAFGQAYTFTVQAHNESEFPSGWSPSSASETPSTTPSAPQNVTLVFAPDDYHEGGNTLSASWSAPADTGGADLTEYTVDYGAGSLNIPAGQTSTKIQGVQDGVSYTVTVTAANRAGVGDPSTSTSAVPFSPPGAVSGVNAVTPNPDKKVVVTWSAATARGRTIDHYEISRDGRDPASVSGTSFTSVELPVGVSTSYKVRACYSAADASFNTCGEWSGASPAAVPYGPPIPVNVWVCGTAPNDEGGIVKFCWDKPTTNGRDAVVMRRIDSGGFGQDPNTDYEAWAYGCDANHSVTVYVQDSEGNTSEQRTATGSVPCPTVATASVYKSSYSGPIGQILWVDVDGFPANTTVSCTAIEPEYFSTYSIITQSTGSGGYHPKVADSSHIAWYAGTGVSAHITCSGGGKTASASASW